VHKKPGPGFTIPAIYGYKRIRNWFRYSMENATKCPWIYRYFYGPVSSEMGDHLRVFSIGIIHSGQLNLLPSAGLEMGAGKGATV